MDDFNVIKCNGMMGMWCKKCVYCPKYEVINEDEYTIECFAPDIDGLPVVGKMKEENS